MLKQIYDMIADSKEYKYSDLLSSFKKLCLVIYGAGGIGFTTYRVLKNKGFNICYFVDDSEDKQGTYIDGIKVVSIKDINPVLSFSILICTPNPMNVYHKLMCLGYKNIYYYPLIMIEKGFFNTGLIKKNLNSIKKVYNLLADNFSKYVFCNILKHRVTMDYTYFENIISYKQYFPSDLFLLNKQECFVDGGVYNAETILEFINLTNNYFKYIYGFEPDKQNYEISKNHINNINNKNIKLYNLGLYSKTGEISFNSLGNSGSFISETGTDLISLVKLDEVNIYQPTYIKLDIEGSEVEALLGMKNIIKNYQPKLAISIYHKATDLWVLPLLIHKLNPSYRIYIRHYLYGLNETVCYAV